MKIHTLAKNHAKKASPVLVKRIGITAIIFAAITFFFSLTFSIISIIISNYLIITILGGVGIAVTSLLSLIFTAIYTWKRHEQWVKVAGIITIVLWLGIITMNVLGVVFLSSQSSNGFLLWYYEYFIISFIGAFTIVPMLAVSILMYLLVDQEKPSYIANSILLLVAAIIPVSVGVGTTKVNWAEGRTWQGVENGCFKFEVLGNGKDRSVNLLAWGDESALRLHNAIIPNENVVAGPFGQMLPIFGIELRGNSSSIVGTFTANSVKRLWMDGPKKDEWQSVSVENCVNFYNSFSNTSLVNIEIGKPASGSWAGANGMHTFERCRELKKLTIHGNIKLSDLDGWINPDTTNVFLDVPDDGTLYLPDTDKDVRDAILQKLKTWTSDSSNHLPNHWDVDPN